jgi:hypothetical protein
VTGHHEHDGVHHFLIRQPHGSSFQIPDWMFDSSACPGELVTVPRVPVSQLILLRALLDHLLACPSEPDSKGTIDHEEAESDANRPIRNADSVRRTERRRQAKGIGASAGASDRGAGDDNIVHLLANGLQAGGGR